MLLITPLKDIPLVRQGDDLADIIVNAKDSMSLGSQTVGLYQLSYIVQDQYGFEVAGATNKQSAICNI